jgi:acetolactate synthase-1/2/3 large subunit
VGRLWDEADVVVAIGTDFDGMMTQNWLMPQPPHLLAINIDPDEAAKNYLPELTLIGDARTLTSALAERVQPRATLDALTQRLGALAGEVRQAIADDEPQALELLDVMRTTLPADAVLVADMCIPGYWLGGFHPVRSPRGLEYPVGWGTLGFAFPASLGASLAGRGRTICVCGDGGFLFACGELATAAQEELPVTVVLVDDGGYGMLRFDQVHAGADSFGVDLHTPDFVALAESFGVPATRVEGFGDEFAAALANSMQATGPAMIVVDAALKPPPNTSPRWYRRRASASNQGGSQ